MAKLNKSKYLFFIGTRPEAIKMAPVIKIFLENNNEVIVCNTGQHDDLLNPILTFFDIKIDYSLRVMTPNQSLSTLSSTLITKISDIISKEKPNFVFVHGDTTTSFIAALCSFYNKVSIAHIEAGLRTHNKYSPFPEESNRNLTSKLADFHFVPTLKSKENLISENINPESIFLVGNTVIDALLHTIKIIEKKHYQIADIDFTKEIILFTGHRRENFGDNFEEIFNALIEISIEFPNMQIIYPVHPNPNIKNFAEKKLGSFKNIKLIQPLNYDEFIYVMNKSKIIITDSGGIQEEAPTLGKPVIVIRNTTERPEAVEAGTSILTGANKTLILDTVRNLINNPVDYTNISKIANPYGDGKAANYIYNTFL